MKTNIRVNNTIHELALDSRLTLLDALRDVLGLTGTKKGCDQGASGACTVIIEGQRVLSCLTLAAACEGQHVVTIEGLAKGDELHPMQAAFLALRWLSVRLLHAWTDPLGRLRSSGGARRRASVSRKLIRARLFALKSSATASLRFADAGRPAESSELSNCGILNIERPIGSPDTVQPRSIHLSETNEARNSEALSPN